MFSQALSAKLPESLLELIVYQLIIQTLFSTTENSATHHGFSLTWTIVGHHNQIVRDQPLKLCSSFHRPSGWTFTCSGFAHGFPLLYIVNVHHNARYASHYSHINPFTINLPFASSTTKTPHVPPVNTVIETLTVYLILKFCMHA